MTSVCGLIIKRRVFETTPVSLDHKNASIWKRFYLANAGQEFVFLSLEFNEVFSLMGERFRCDAEMDLYYRPFQSVTPVPLFVPKFSAERTCDHDKQNR